MTSWFKKRGSVPHLDQLNPIPQNQPHELPNSPSHNNKINSPKNSHRQRAISDFNGLSNPSQYHYIIKTLISNESFHIFSSSNIQHIKTEILKTIVDQSAFGPEIEHLNWNLYHQNIKLTTNSQLFSLINQQLTQNKQTIHLQIKLIHDQKYDKWLTERQQNVIIPPQIGKITYGDFSCCLQIDCGWKEPIINAYKVQYQFILMEHSSDYDISQAKIYTSDHNIVINIKDIWPWLGYKCRVRLTHRLFNIKSNWSEWTENITVSTKPLDMHMNDEKKQFDIDLNSYNNSNNVSYFECMDHKQLKQWTQFKLFGDVINPLLVYDDEKNTEITNTLSSKMWSTYIEKESGLLSLVQFAITESQLNGKQFLFHDPEEFINQLLPIELVEGKSIVDGGYGREDYLCILWRLRELAFLEGNNMRYSMGIPCYNPYTIFVWIYFLKIPRNKYALYCRHTQSYVLLKHFYSQHNNECHLFWGKYYIRKPAEMVNVSFELHEIVKLNGFDGGVISLTQSKPVLLSGDKQLIIVHTNNNQHVIGRCYNQQKKNEDIITKFKVIEDWVNFFVTRWKVHGVNLPYFECILNGIFEKIGDEIALAPAIDVMHLIYVWHSKSDKNKQKAIVLTKEKLKKDCLMWLKPDICKRNEIVKFLFYMWWVIGGSHNNEIPQLFNYSSITMHKIQQVLFGKFGSLDRVFPLLRTIFHDKSEQYMEKIAKSLTKSHNSLGIRMQLLLWYNFMNSVINKQNVNINNEHLNIKMRNNITKMELTPNLIQMIQIDVELEQQTTIERAYPLECDAFYALRINASRNNECDIMPSKYMEKLVCLLLIFKPNYHFIINEYKMDIIQILKREMNPMQCLDVMYKILNINGTENEQAFISLMDPFVPKLSVESPLLLQTHFQKLLKEYNSKDVIGFDLQMEQKNNSQNFELMAVKHRFSMLNKQNTELKQQLSEYKAVLQSVQNDENNNNKMKTEINEILNENYELKQMLKQNQFDLDQSNKNYMNTIKLLTQQNMQTQIQLNTQKESYDEINEQLNVKINEMERLKQEINELRDNGKKRFRPFLCSNVTDELIEENDNKLDVIRDNIDSEALKIELLNYMKFSATHATSKKYLSLMQFHSVKAQILLNWKYIKSQTYDNLIEQLMDFMDENDIKECEEKMIYNLCYELIMECYEFMNGQKHKYNPMVFNVIYLNLPIFYALKINKKLVEMLENVYSFLDFIIDSICGLVYKKYEFMNEIQKELKECFDKLIMDCCSVIWSLIHYEYYIGPNISDINNHKIFDDSIHKKENEGGDNIQCFVFPSVCHTDACNTLRMSDIWVFCDE